MAPFLAPLPHRFTGAAGLSAFIAAAMLVVTVAIEVVLWGADQGLWGSRIWRSSMVQYGAFWPGLLSNWRPNYALQPQTMFLTYALIHVGPAHLFGNLAGAIWLATNLVRRIDWGSMIVIYWAGAVGGGLVYALLPTGSTPVVGASGAVFALAGAQMTLDARLRARSGRRGWALLAPTLGFAALLVAVNLVGIFGQEALAWQAHLGGALTGAAFATQLSLPPPSRRLPNGTKTPLPADEPPDSGSEPGPRAKR